MTHATQQTGAISAGAIGCLLSLAIVLPSVVLLLMLHFAPLVVTLTGDAGTFGSAVSSKDLTNVHTSLGTLTVAGGFSAPAGQALLLRYTNKRGLQLCPVTNTHACAEVAGPWAVECDRWRTCTIGTRLTSRGIGSTPAVCPAFSPWEA